MRAAATRYRALVRFGPWERGDEFESEDEFHATLAAAGRLLVAVDGASPARPAQGEA